MKKRHQQKLIILSLILWVLFNFPVLFIFNVQDQILGFPIIYFYIFSIGFVSVTVSYLILNKHFE